MSLLTDQLTFGGWDFDDQIDCWSLQLPGTQDEPFRWGRPALLARLDRNCEYCRQMLRPSPRSLAR